jgi:MerR family transcriptional regulator, copper efflux regulator
MNGMRISELSRRSGLPASTLRYYEDLGLLPAERDQSGYRVYDEHAEHRLDFINAAKRLELSLPAIGDLLEVWEADACRSVKEGLRPVLQARIDATDHGIAALRDVRARLEAARVRLEMLPDRDEPCDAECAFLLEGSAPESVEQSPIACTLESGDYQSRIADWERLVEGCHRETVDGGVQVIAPSDRAGELAALIVAEQTCCAFLDFRMTFDRSTVVLVITAPPGAEELAHALVAPHGAVST